MVKPESPGQKREKPEKQPVARVDLQNSIDAKIRAEAEKMLSDAGFLAKLSDENISRFIKSHSATDYQNYREWNEDFCESVLGLKNAPAADQRINVMALQLFLQKKIGGFLEGQGRMESLDGKLGPHTMGKIKECYEKIEKKEPPKPPSAQRTQETVSGSAALIEKYDPRHVRYAGDSIMQGILLGKKVSDKNKRAVSSSQLVYTDAVAKNANYIKNRCIFIENEALRFIDKTPECKLLVINGGVNDLYGRGAGKTTIDQIKSAYKRIIDKAHAKGIKVAVYNLNTKRERADMPQQQKLEIRGATVATAEINQWLLKESGADVILDTDAIVHGRVTGPEGLHATGRAYKDLHAALASAALIRQV